MTLPLLLISETDLFTALRSFLTDVVPPDVDVIQGQNNRVPEPKSPDFVTMTPIFRGRLATNVTTTFDGAPTEEPGTRTDTMGTRVTVQLDVHGPNSADNAQLIATLFRSDIATDYFEALGVPIAPLFTEDPHQLPYLNAEQQVENRWVVDTVLQANIGVQSGQEFADSLTIRGGIIDVDVVYPP